MAGNWRQAGAAHFEEWLCALLACALASSSCPGGGGRESFDYFHRLRLIPAKGHCSLWAAQTKRLPANNSQDTPALPKISLHTPAPDNSDIDCCQEVATAVPFLSEMAVDAALSSVSSNKAEKAACSSNGGRVGHKLEEEVHLGWEVDAEVEELQLGGVTTNQPALVSPPANCCRLIMQ